MKKIKKGLLIASIICVGSVSVGLFGACNKQEKNLVKYTFNTVGGNTISAKETSVGSKFTLPIPTRDGYVFEGWYTNAEYTGEAVTEVTASVSQTYYAKWTELYTVTLNPNGGTLSTQQFSLKKGENLYNALQDYVPVKDNHQFGAWVNGETEISSNTRIESNLTLTAKYKVAYKVECYLETIEGGSYVKAEDKIGYAYAATDFVSEQRLTGFREISHTDAIVRLTISEDASKNVFKHYFDREIYTVTFNPNYPNNASGESRSETVVYGVEIVVPSDYSYEGYCFVGWSTSTTGEVVYNANYINNALFNKDDDAPTVADKFVPERDMALYAVWQKGYTDMLYESDDSIFVLDETSGVAYLSRGDFFFKGTYDATKREFRFTDLAEMIMGRLNEDGTYIYYDATRAEVPHTLYEVGSGLVDTTTIVFDAYNGISYYEADKTTSRGTYVKENGYHIATFTEGDLAGQTLTLLVTTRTLDETPTPIFQRRNEKEIAMGTIVYYTVKNGAIVEDEYNKLKLNGFGGATISGKGENTNCSYTYDEENGELKLTTSETTVICKLLTLNGNLGYMEYVEDMDRTIEMSSGESLTLNGVANAVYTQGSKTVEGLYTYETSRFGGTIVSMTADSGEEYAFMVTTQKSEISGEGGVSETVTVYSAERKVAGYKEYLYMDAEGAYYAPMLVVNEPEQGKATLYGYTNQTHVKVSVGSYTKNKETGTYLYEAEEYFEVPAEGLGAFDLKNVKSFVYNLDTELNQYGLNVLYWHSVTMNDDVSDSFEQKYVSDLGGTLMLVGGFAFYDDKGFVITGTYSTDETTGVTTITTPLGSVWVEIYSSGKFLTLDSRPYHSYLINEKGEVNRRKYLSFNGKGGVTYVELTLNDQAEETGRVEYTGESVRLNEAIKEGANVYEFRSDALTFKYLPLGDSNANSYYSPYNAEYNNQYDSARDASYLELDGYGYMAYYTNAEGESVKGRYSLVEENVVAVALSSGTRYFDLLADRKFTVRGQEYGEYILMENRLTSGQYVELDGYNNLTVYKYTDPEDTESRVDIDTEGTYEIDGKLLTLRYKENGEDAVVKGRLEGSYFVTMNENVVQTFVNKTDWSILVLDAYGHAEKYDAEGKKDVGTYLLITDTLLYFVNDAEDDACIYKYDRAANTATPIKFTARSYYTEDFEALLFSEYGFAIFNDSTRYYYNVVNGEVIMYRQAEPSETENINEYGFVEDASFGQFDDVKTIGDKTYYANSGYAIEFTRKAETKDAYPVLVGENVKMPMEKLTFAPSGETEFSVIGDVVLNGTHYACRVTREINDNGEVEMYVTIGAGVGNYRFDISAVYTGTDEDGEGDNQYEVTGMSWVVSAYSYAYLDTYYTYFLNDYYYGTSMTSSYENDRGFLLMHRVYNEAGEEMKDEHFVSGIFFEGSKMYDTTGTIITVEKAKLDESLLEEKGVYIAILTAEDGYVYRIYFSLAYHSAFGLYGYKLTAFTREEVLEANDGYTIIVERKIATDTQYNSEYDYKTTIKKGEESIVLDDLGAWGIIYDHTYYMAYKYDENDREIGVTYYSVWFTTNSSSEVGEEKVLATYATGTVKVEEVEILYVEGDDASYAHISPSLGVTIFFYESSFNIAQACTYDEQTQTYRVKSFSVEYLVKVVGEYIEISLAESEE